VDTLLPVIVRALVAATASAVLCAGTAHAAPRAGDVVQTQPAHVPLAASAQKILYRSTDLHGNPSIVGATVVEPSAPWTGPGLQPVVSFAPGSQGQGDQCAPSHALESGTFYEIEWVADLLTHGWVVVVTDYPGLGTPGVHTYLNRVEEGHAVLDAARATLRLRHSDPATPVGIGGYSQGGRAAAAAAELQPSYAPDLHVAGIYAGAVQADLGAMTDDDSLGSDLPYEINGFVAAYPERAQAIRAVFNDRGKAVLDAAAGQCMFDTELEFGQIPTNDVTSDGRTIRAHLTEEPFASILADQRIGNGRSSAPVLMVQGANDDNVPADQARQLAREWCAKGATVDYEELALPPILPGSQIGHAVPSFPATVMGIDYLAARFNGVQASDHCP
jgi:pimeloyl-ACP methyl ester carboxylesterase